MTGGQLAADVAISLGGALLGAGVPVLVVGFKLAAAWGGLVERVNDLEQDARDHEGRIRIVEQRGPRASVRAR